MKKFFIFFFCFSSLTFLHAQPENKQPSIALSKFEPPDGKTYHGVGQANTGVTEYITALNDSSIHPITRNFYYDIPGTRGDKFQELRQTLALEKQIGRISHLSIAMTDGKVWTDSIIATSNRYDYVIDSIASICKEYGKRMFIRPGFEFGGSWFAYHPYLYPIAFQKIVNRFKAIGAADSCAFFWCYYSAAPNDFDSVDARGARWYPGDNYVDWFSLDLFNAVDFHPDSASIKRGQLTAKGKSERFLSVARSKGKPVFLSEVSAAGMNFTTDTTDGINDWNGWFEPFFKFLTLHQEIKGFNYTNWNWSQYGQWKEWGDARIEVNPYVINKYREEMHKSKFIHLPFTKTIIDTTTRVPDKVILLAPPNNSDVQGTTTQLRWQKSQPNVDRYYLEVANDSRFINMIVNDSTVIDTTRTLNGLLNGGKYFWRVQAHNSIGWGEVSDIRMFGRKDTIIINPVAHITVDANVLHQTMEGWGASSNFTEEQVARLDPGIRKEIFDLVFRDLGANILCIRLYSNFQTSKGGPYNWDVMASQRLIVNEALSRGKINYIWLKVSSPPGWMKNNGTAENGGHVKQEFYQDYADYLSYYIQHMKSDYGITINAVSMFNEPGYVATYESSTTTPQEYRDILKIVAATFARDGLQSVGLIGPESGSIGQNQNYFNTILTDPDAEAVLQHITTHQYGDQLLLYGTGAGDQWNWLRTLAANHRKNVWESEIYIGGPNMASSDIDEALRVALLMWNAVTNGDVTAWHYWHYIWADESKQGKAQGLVALQRDGTYSVFPRYYAFKHWSYFIHPLATRIDAASDNPAIRVAAFRQGKEYCFIVFNQSDIDISTTFSSPIFNHTVAHYRTSTNENLITQSPLPPGNPLSVLIKAKSISTFVMNIGVGIDEPLSSPGKFALDIYPHPVRNAATVTVRVPNDGLVKITLHDLFGREIETLLDEPLRAGEHEITHHALQLKPGIYFYTLSTGKLWQTKSFVVLE